MNLSFTPVNESNRNVYQRLLICLFPVPYPPSFMRDICKGKIKAFLVSFEGDPDYFGCVGWKTVGNEEDKTIELLNFGVLVLKRERGIGSEMLRWFLDENPDSKVILHVVADNSTAVEFYSKRGFICDDEEVKNYYPRLPNPAAKLMRLNRSSL